MSKLIIANWKLNPSSLVEAKKLAKASDVAGLVICPPFTFIKAMSEVLEKAKLGAQDFQAGLPARVEYVIVGHSDRRKLGETDEIVAGKMKAVLEAGLIPILCVGETRAERDAGKTKEVVERELKIGLSLVASGYTLNPIIAYEPIWAIGTGTPDSPENMLEMVKFIKTRIKNYELGIMEVRVLYGGSVTNKNAESFLRHREIDGALVGGASLNPAEIIKVVEIASRYS